MPCNVLQSATGSCNAWQEAVMKEFAFTVGSEVTYQGQAYRVKSPISLERVRLEHITNYQETTAKISDLSPAIDARKRDARENLTDLVMISEADWEEAKRRETILKPLSQQTTCSLDEAKQAAKELGLSWRQIYNLLKRYREYDEELLALIPHQSLGGKGKPRIQLIAEKIIQDVIIDGYLPQQRTKACRIVEAVIRDCRISGVKPPSERTIRRRIEDLWRKAGNEYKRRRHASKQYEPVLGNFPETSHPHEIWQIDHTPVDIIIVDEVYRKPIGRPYLTIAIDMNSRCIPGFCLTLEVPSSTSVGLCLTHSVFDKEEWLAQRNIKTQWPIWGKPGAIHLDNAAEFHGDALKRGCEAHGIDIFFRPPAQPYYGGTIERVIGTLMQLAHDLPGTTFSNTKEKGNYPSEKKAVLTLPELEYWLTLAITDYYHQKVHSSIHLPPIAHYRDAVLGTKDKPGMGYPAKIHNKQAFLIDFLPIEWRTLQRHGFMLDHISYNSPVLSPFIANREKYQRFLIRRDPRDLSRIYVLEPHSHRYLEIPYRTLSRPAITLWEHKRAVAFLNDRGLNRMNEVLIFQAIEKMREIVKSASKKTKAARRQQAKTRHHLEKKCPKTERSTFHPKTTIGQVQKTKDSDTEEIKPFEDIEVW